MEALEYLYRLVNKPVFPPDHVPNKWVAKHATLLYLSLFNLAEHIKCVAKQGLRDCVHRVLLKHYQTQIIKILKVYLFS